MVRDLWGYFRSRRKHWLLPVVLLLVLFGAVMVLANSSAIAPFIYTIF